MAYIPLDQGLRMKGETAVDVIGNPCWKGGRALILGNDV